MAPTSPIQNDGLAGLGLRQKRALAPASSIQSGVWSGVFFWIGLGVCGLISLGAILQILDPDSARERMNQREAVKQATIGAPHKQEMQRAETDQPGCAVNLGNFMRLKAGMAYREVRSILKCDGIEISRTEIAGIPTTVMYQWAAGRGFGNMNAMFQGDQLVNKAQFGLE